MKAETWIALSSVAISASSLLLTLWNSRRTSDASLRAVNADIRAEEALQAVKSIEERDRRRFEGEKAEIEAPQIADRWVTEISFLWTARTRNGTYRVSKPVKTPAERRAVEIVRASKDSLNLIGVVYEEDKQVCMISGWNIYGFKKHMNRVGDPPKLRGAG